MLLNQILIILCIISMCHNGYKQFTLCLSLGWVFVLLFYVEHYWNLLWKWTLHTWCPKESERWCTQCLLGMGVWEYLTVHGYKLASFLGSLLKNRGGESLVTFTRKAVNFQHVIIHVINAGRSHFNNDCHVIWSAAMQYWYLQFLSSSSRHPQLLLTLYM